MQGTARIWASALLCIGCSESPRTLRVELRTDYIPVSEFSSVEVAVLDAEPTSPHRVSSTLGLRVTPDLDFLEGEVIGNLDGRDVVALRVSLLRSDRSVVAERFVVPTTAGGEATAITVVISRACADVECPGRGDPADAISCRGGQCVDPRCTLEAAEHCPDPIEPCESDDECPTLGCLAGRCEGNFCLEVPDSSLCEDDETCDVAEGCVISACVDEGEACELDVPCWLGELSCVDRESNCVVDTTAPGGSTCPGGSCDSLGSCDPSAEVISFTTDIAAVGNTWRALAAGEGVVATVTTTRLTIYDAATLQEAASFGGAFCSVAASPDGEVVAAAIGSWPCNAFAIYERRDGTWAEVEQVSVGVNVLWGLTHDLLLVQNINAPRRRLVIPRGPGSTFAESAAITLNAEPGLEITNVHALTSGEVIILMGFGGTRLIGVASADGGWSTTTIDTISGAPIDDRVATGGAYAVWQRPDGTFVRYHEGEVEMLPTVSTLPAHVGPDGMFLGLDGHASLSREVIPGRWERSVLLDLDLSDGVLARGHFIGLSRDSNQLRAYPLR